MFFWSNTTNNILTAFFCNLKILRAEVWFPHNTNDVHRCGTGGSMRVCHAAGPGSIPCRDRFPGWGFFGFFCSPVRQMSENFRPTKVPEYHLAAIIIISYSPCRNGRVCALWVSSFMFVLSRSGPGIELITHPGRPPMSLCGQKSMYVIQRLIPSPDRSWLCKARAAWVT